MMKFLNPKVDVSDKLLSKLIYIDEIDFSLLRKKLSMKAPLGYEWSEEFSREVEKWYKRYLALNLIKPEHVLVPTFTIDVFWHYHILHTKKYQIDCANLLGTGRLIHHYPYFGIDGEETKAETAQAADETNSLYEVYFGESIYGTAGHLNNKKVVCENSDADDGCKNGCYNEKEVQRLNIQLLQ